MQEYEHGRMWVRDNLTFDSNETVSVLELNVRALAGLLAAFELTGERTFLQRCAPISLCTPQGAD